MTTTRELVEELERLKAALQQADLSERQLEEVAAAVQRLLGIAATPRKKRSILELKGLGKEYWRSLDVEKYLHEERESWR